MISIAVAGEPAPKGSMRAMLVQGKPRVIPGGSPANQRALKAWERSVREHVYAVLGDAPLPMFKVDPLEVILVFKLARPSSHFGKNGLLPSAPRHPWTKPDIDKLARSTLDACTGLLWDDDSRIAVLTMVKQWAPMQSLAESGHTGVTITVEPLGTEPRRAQTENLQGSFF